MLLHHATLFVRDIEASLAFYREGLGLEVLMDSPFDGPWPELFDVGTREIRAIILGDKDRPKSGHVELLTFAEPVEQGPGPVSPPQTGSLLLSFMVDLDAVLPRLEANGATDVRRNVLQRGNAIAALRDPDGILIELLDIGAKA